MEIDLKVFGTFGMVDQNNLLVDYSYSLLILGGREQ